ncbi:MAG TPA: prepilin-type N-terminal cleavage/methylation domain-containing protein [Thermoanaerobaculia bacterium]|nr:prepilin-type N-terminal cleavage/methylation domain-containing protein [Thermoanaerobaculia bacterium]
MQTRTFSSIQRQRGYTLIEILVAVAIFATVMIVALLLYDQSNRVFKQANESAEMQQNTRVAFEKVVADLRMAGFDYKRAGAPPGGTVQEWKANTDYSVGTMVTPSPPNGHVYKVITAGKSGGGPAWKTGTGDIVDDGTVQWQEAGAPTYEQPDEQIEFAHDKAITIRANFDYEDPTTPNQGRETDLETASKGHFPVVTTGNDEIVTYALVSRSGNASANKDKITFFADVNNGGTPSRNAYPGGSPEREITITGVDLTNKYPPYTLMRYTLNAAGEVVTTALADNIRSIEFKYWEDASAKTALRDLTEKKITDFTTVAGLGQYDPNDPNAIVGPRLIRGKVRAVTATIVGMSPQADYDYTSATDTVAKNYRQYTLQSTIVGRNLGLRGMPQSNTNPPGPPTIKNSCNGYCGVAYLTWAPAPNSGDETYTILYDTSPSGSFSGVIPAGTQTYYAVDLTQLDLSKTYYFRVAATNAAGTTVSTGSALALNLKNVTKPNAPSISAVSTDQKNAIRVTFSPGGGNATGAPSCSSGAPPFQTAPAEIKGYRIYRHTEADFDPNADEGTLVLDENTPGLSSTGAGGFVFTDTKVANCQDYYYKVATVEWCNVKGEYNTSGSATSALSDFSAANATAARAVSTEKPKKPTNLKPHVTSVCDPVANRCDPVTLLWDKVTRDVTEAEIEVMRYKVTRVTKLNNATVDTKELGTVTDGTTTFTDNDKLLEHNPALETMKFLYEYQVQAEQCNVQGEAATLTYPGACVTGAKVVADADGPGSGTQDDPLQNVTSLGVAEYPGQPIKEASVSVDGAAYQKLDPPFNFDWDIVDGEVHRVAFKVVIEKCTEILPFYVLSDPADCRLSASVSNIVGDNSRVQLTLTNTSDVDVSLDSFDIRWLGQSGLSWQNVRLPSGTVVTAGFTAPATAASPRTVRIVPGNATDKTVKKRTTYVMTLTFTGGTPVPGTIGAVSVDYHEAGNDTQFGCSTQLAACGVTATISVTEPQIIVAIKNNTGETLTVTELQIAWTGQTNWQWNGITADTTTINLATPATSAATHTFKPTDVTVSPGATLNIAMNMEGTAKKPPTLQGNVGTVYMSYTTPTSAPTVLVCKAR